MDQINNMLIISPPKAAESKEQTMKTALDINFLDKDFLKFDDLNVNLLTVTGGRLDVNALDNQFLLNMLDLLNSQLLENMLNDPTQMLINYKPNKNAGLLHYIDYNAVTLYRTAPTHFASVTLDKDSATTVNLTQDDVPIKQVVNRTGGSVINIKQVK
jgi:hypothetical protein